MGTEASEELPLVLRTAPSDAASVVASSDSPNTGASLAGAHAVSVDDPAGAGEYSQVRYLRSSPLRLGLYIALCIATGVVVLPFFARWYPVVFTLIAREEITDAKERRSADYALCWPRKGGKPVECRIQRLRTSPASSLSAHVRAALPMADEFVFFEFRKLRYVYDHALNDYQPLKHALEVDFETLHEKFKNHGLTAQDHQHVIARNGDNKVDPELPPIWWLFLKKIAHPFYVFQLFSAIVWFCEDYTVYAIVILITSFISIIWEIYLARDNAVKLRKIARVQTLNRVLRDDKIVQVDSDQLAVGDVVLLDNNGQITCDMVIVNGGCVADETSLTGESAPVVKSSLASISAPGVVYHPEKFKNNTVFAGCVVIQTKPGANGTPATAVVVRAGFHTAKGNLLRNIMFPEKLKFRFYSDSLMYLTVLGVIGIAAVILVGVRAAQTNNIDTIPVDERQRLSPQQLADRQRQMDSENALSALDKITIAVPPALPLVLTIGVAFAVQSLRRRKIFCIVPERVNYAGRIDFVCLDKTGTLTSENLEYDGLDLCRSEQPELVAAPPDSASSVAVVMRTCHGLATIGEVLVGNSVDRQMFGATGSTLDDGEGFRMRPGLHTAFALVTSPGAFGASSEFAIFRRFDFDPAYQRSSSIYKDLAGESWGVSVKGSAEAVAKVCRPDSVSKNIQDTYAYYARHGWYVLALAHRKLDPAEYENEAFQRLDRFAVERDLEFCGLLLLQNHLKENSKAVIEDLANTDTRAIMVTGDSAWNAIHVSRQAGLISSEAKVMLVQLERGSEIVIREVDGKMEVPSLRDLVQMHQAGSCEIAITGNALLHLAKNVNGTAAPMDVTEDENDFTTKLVDWILTDGCRIFARVAPDQKTWIVKQLIRLNYQVAHVGDGTNDAGALAAAHIGLALSEAEASIVSPFTSKDKEIGDLTILLREGKCALTTSFIAFKFMTLYPIIQLMMVLYLNFIGSTITNNQYVFDDLAVVFPLALVMCITPAATRSVRARPPSNLFSASIVASVLGQILIAVAFCAIAIQFLLNQPFFCDQTTASSYREVPGWISNSSAQLCADGVFNNQTDLVCSKIPYYAAQPDQTAQLTISLNVNLTETCGTDLFGPNVTDLPSGCCLAVPLPYATCTSNGNPFTNGTASDSLIGPDGSVLVTPANPNANLTDVSAVPANENITVYYPCYSFDITADINSMEQNNDWLYVHLMYAIVAIAYNYGRDAFRRHGIFNWLLTILLVVIIAIQFLMLLGVSAFVDPFQLAAPLPYDFRTWLIGIWFANAAASILYEVLIVQILILNWETGHAERSGKRKRALLKEEAVRETTISKKV